MSKVVNMRLYDIDPALFGRVDNLITDSRTYNNTFVPGGTWLQPQTILTARMVKSSAEFTF
jgi:hypothetical protein